MPSVRGGRAASAPLVRGERVEPAGGPETPSRQAIVPGSRSVTAEARTGGAQTPPSGDPGPAEGFGGGSAGG